MTVYARAWFALIALFTLALFVPVLYGQAVQTVTPQADGANEWGGALVWAFFSSSSLEWVKRKQALSILTERTAWLTQRLIGVVLATAAALGVHWSFDPQIGRLVIDGLILSSMWTIGTETIRQWVLQELTYRTAIKPYRPEKTI